MYQVERGGGLAGLKKIYNELEYPGATQDHSYIKGWLGFNQNDLPCIKLPEFWFSIKGGIINVDYRCCAVIPVDWFIEYCKLFIL